MRAATAHLLARLPALSSAEGSRRPESASMVNTNNSTMKRCESLTGL